MLQLVVEIGFRTPRLLQRDRDHFLCRAVSEEHAGEVLTLKDIEAARRAYRRALRATINERVARVADFLPVRSQPTQSTPPPKTPTASIRSKLRVYQEGEQ